MVFMENPMEIWPDRPQKGLRTHFAVADLPQILRGSTRVHRSVAAAALNGPVRCVVKTLRVGMGVVDVKVNDG